MCKHFDMNSKLCLIYHNRPDKCNIDKMYEEYYKYKMSLEDYYQLNYEACENLKNEVDK